MNAPMRAATTGSQSTSHWLPQAVVALTLAATACGSPEPPSEEQARAARQRAEKAEKLVAEGRPDPEAIDARVTALVTTLSTRLDRVEKTVDDLGTRTDHLAQRVEAAPSRARTPAAPPPTARC